MDQEMFEQRLNDLLDDFKHNKGFYGYARYPDTPVDTYTVVDDILFLMSELDEG